MSKKTVMTKKYDVDDMVMISRKVLMSTMNINTVLTNGRIETMIVMILELVCRLLPRYPSKLRIVIYSYVQRREVIVKVIVTVQRFNHPHHFVYNVA